MVKSASKNRPGSAPNQAQAKQTGSFIYTDGSRYEGEYTESDNPNASSAATALSRQRSGIGTYTCQRSGCVYTGSWVADCMGGGKGRMVYPSGAVYDGMWNQSQYAGQGTYTFPDGSKYEGEWSEGRMHGPGTFVDNKGKKWVGVCQMGIGADLAPEIV
ncbi:hypothetical protein PhCBS80983_g04190 [Powellomyces hirtus]|uniref:MORN repeat-containing protein 5 n=1 Tax=Powellomyces hirtus TaxID=109895 RepID=A0A507DYR4_9FUNG|nr:hypothetical protein PhCBS80983_g04190 [Powellomyces hirtus]